MLFVHHRNDQPRFIWMTPHWRFRTTHLQSIQNDKSKAKNKNTSSVISVAIDLPISWYCCPLPSGPRRINKNLQIEDNFKNRKGQMVESSFTYCRNTYFKIGLKEPLRQILYINCFKIFTHAFKHEALVRKDVEITSKNIL